MGLLRFSVEFPRLHFSKFGARLTADPTRYASRQAGRETTYWAEVGYLVNRGNVPGASGLDLRAGFHFSVGW